MLPAAAEEHKGPEIMALNPRGQVPTLVDGDIVVCESLAALFYLEDAYPEHKLMPSGKKERAEVTSLYPRLYLVVSAAITHALRDF